MAPPVGSSWTCINRLPSFPQDTWLALRHEEPRATHPVVESTASKHRDSVFRSANKLVQSSKKRKAPAESFKVTKKRADASPFLQPVADSVQGKNESAASTSTCTDARLTLFAEKCSTQADCEAATQPTPPSTGCAKFTIVEPRLPIQHEIITTNLLDADTTLPDDDLPSLSTPSTSDDSRSSGWSDHTIVTNEEDTGKVVLALDKDYYANIMEDDLDEDFPSFEELTQINGTQDTPDLTDVIPPTARISGLSDKAEGTLGPRRAPPTPAPLHPTTSTQVTPFLRTTHPKPIPELSDNPLPLMTSQNRIITCFRVAELLRLVPPTGGTLTFELFARVVHSARTSSYQSFQFADIFFPTRPPYMHARCTTWQDNDLYNEDAAAFLSTHTKDRMATEGSQKLCRAIVKASTTSHNMGNRLGASTSPSQKLSTGGSVTFEVLSIWESTWANVEHVRGIVDPQH